MIKQQKMSLIWNSQIDKGAQKLGCRNLERSYEKMDELVIMLRRMGDNKRNLI